MDDIIEYLTAVPAWYLATCEGDQPRVRPFSFVMREGDTLGSVLQPTKMSIISCSRTPNSSFPHGSPAAAGSSLQA